MGRLFWKFFVAFWLALLAAGATVGGVAWLHQRSIAPLENSVERGPRTAMRISAASAVLKYSGVAALKAMLQEENRPDRPPLLAVDASGKDVLGRPVADEILSNARRLVAANPLHGGARLVSDPSGDTMLLFIPVMSAGIRAGPGGDEFAPPPDDRPPPSDRPRGDRPPSFDRPPGGRGPSGPPLEWLAAIGVLASLSFSALLAWYFYRPIRSLRWAFTAAARGNLDVRVQPLIGKRRDEIADLGLQFDHMVQQLQQLLASQRRLFHDVSHELRSPLARLEAAVGLARKSPERVEACLQRMEIESGRLNALVGEVLTLARLESNTDMEPAEPLDVLTLVASVVEDAAFEAEQRRITITFERCETVMVNGRAEMLHRAFDNVIRNAVKFAPEGSIVEVRSKLTAEHQLYVSVADAGPGLSAEELGQIFRPFFRGTNGTTPGTPGVAQGTGLGLAIAERAVHAHAGRIRATNLPSKGLLVVIELPLA